MDGKINYQTRLWRCRCGEVNDGIRCDRCGKIEGGCERHGEEEVMGSDE